MARLFMTKKTSTEYGLTLASGTCGGSIISPNVILTAAHCLENATKIQVQLGHYDSNSVLSITAEVKSYIIHSSWKMGQQSNSQGLHDIALLKLSDDLIFSKSIKPINLPRQHLFESIRKFDKFSVAGWGTSTDILGEAVMSEKYEYDKEKYAGLRHEKSENTFLPQNMKKLSVMPFKDPFLCLNAHYTKFEVVTTPKPMKIKPNHLTHKENTSENFKIILPNLTCKAITYKNMMKIKSNSIHKEMSRKLKKIKPVFMGMEVLLYTPLCATSIKPEFEGKNL